MDRFWVKPLVAGLLVLAASGAAVGLPLPSRRLAATPRPIAQVAMRDFTLHFDHSLGAPEAKRRIAEGIEELRKRYGSKFSAVDIAWHDNDADIRVAALSQTANGHVAISDKAVDVRVHLPLLLSPFAEQVSKVLNKDALKALKRAAE